MKKNKNPITKSQLLFKRGFSLIELLVVIAIIFIMTTIALTINTKSSASKDVENAAQVIAAQIRALQNESLSGKIIAGTPVNKFKFDSSASSYMVSYLDSSNNTLGSPIVANPKFVTLSAATIIFQPPFGIVNASTINITSTKDANNSCSKIDISANGNIEITKKSTCN